MPATKTFADIISDCNVRFQQMMGPRMHEHGQAWVAPRGMEKPVVQLVYAIASYGDAVMSELRWNIGDDYVLGAYWKDLIQATRGLLNGDCGRLDCGTVDHMLCEMQRAAGLGDE